MSKFKCGDHVKLINAGLTYSNYESWIKEKAPMYLEMWEKSCRERTLRDRGTYGSHGIVVAVASHSSYADEQVCLVDFFGIKDRSNERLFDMDVFEMVAPEGLEKIELDYVLDYVEEKK